MVASDLASLREQAGDYPGFTAADIRDPAAFGRALRAAFDNAVASGPRAGAGASGVAPSHGTGPAPVDHTDWEPSVAAVLGVQVA